MSDKIVLSKKVESRQSESMPMFSTGRRVYTTISQEAVASVVERMTDLYKDPALATLREVFSNAYDATVAAGATREVEPPSIQTPTFDSPVLVISDHGDGMDEATIENNYKNMGSSSKAEDMSQIGAMGAGAKAPLAYTDTFYVKTVNQGVLREFTFAWSKEGPYIEYTKEEATDLPSGTTVEIPAQHIDIEAGTFDALVVQHYVSSCPIAFVYNGVLVDPAKTQVVLTKASVGGIDLDVVLSKFDLWRIAKSISTTGWQEFFNTDFGDTEFFDLFGGLLFNQGYGASVFDVLQASFGGWHYALADESRGAERGRPSTATFVRLQPGVVMFPSSRDEIKKDSRFRALKSGMLDLPILKAVANMLGSSYLDGMSEKDFRQQMLDYAIPKGMMDATYFLIGKGTQRPLYARKYFKEGISLLDVVRCAYKDSELLEAIVSCGFTSNKQSVKVVVGKKMSARLAFGGLHNIGHKRDALSGDAFLCELLEQEKNKHKVSFVQLFTCGWHPEEDYPCIFIYGDTLEELAYAYKHRRSLGFAAGDSEKVHLFFVKSENRKQVEALAKRLMSGEQKLEVLHTSVQQAKEQRRKRPSVGAKKATSVRFLYLNRDGFNDTASEIVKASPGEVSQVGPHLSDRLINTDVDNLVSLARTKQGTLLLPFNTLPSAREMSIYNIMCAVHAWRGRYRVEQGESVLFLIGPSRDALAALEAEKSVDVAYYEAFLGEKTKDSFYQGRVSTLSRVIDETALAQALVPGSADAQGVLDRVERFVREEKGGFHHLVAATSDRRGYQGITQKALDLAIDLTDSKPVKVSGFPYYGKTVGESGYLWEEEKNMLPLAISLGLLRRDGVREKMLKSTVRSVLALSLENGFRRLERAVSQAVILAHMVDDDFVVKWVKDTCSQKFLSESSISISHGLMEYLTPRYAMEPEKRAAVKAEIGNFFRHVQAEVEKALPLVSFTESV